MLKRKSLEELKDCLDVIHSQLQTCFYSRTPNPGHIDKLNKWFDEVSTEIHYRNSITTSTEFTRNYNV